TPYRPPWHKFMLRLSFLFHLACRIQSRHHVCDLGSSTYILCGSLLYYHRHRGKCVNVCNTLNVDGEPKAGVGGASPLAGLQSSAATTHSREPSSIPVQLTTIITLRWGAFKIN